MVKKDQKLFVEDEIESDEGEVIVSDQDSGSSFNAVTAESNLDDSGMEISESESDTDMESNTKNDDDDPIVESIPLYVNSLTSRDSQSVHLLQYPSRPMKAPKPLQHISAAVKPNSNFFQVKVPLDTGRFYDESKTNEWGVSVSEHDQVGVLNKTNGGLYSGKFINENGQKKVILTPIDSTAQLRPSFKYLDDIENSKILQKKETMDSTSMKAPQNVHILQSTAKSNKTSTNDPFATTALGESLKHIRRFDQESWVPLNWFDPTNDDLTDDIKSTYDVVNSAPTTELKASSTMDDYIIELTK